jgi:hypothetical protein
MKTSIISLLILFISTSSFCQDTTWVQTFTFDSIATRRAEFLFPTSLNEKRFEKVLMYYKLKCSPLTTWDSYNCGEWDYLTYTQVFDHTGVMDSVEVLSKQYKVNTDTIANYNYNITPSFDTYQQYQHFRPQTAVSDFTVLSGSGSSMDLIHSSKQGNRVQFIVSATELTAAGIIAGEITSLAFSFNQLGGNVDKMTIKLKATSVFTISNFETSGFTTVYQQNLTGATLAYNDFIFSSPFLWDGTSNIIVEVTFDNSSFGMADYLVDANDQIGVNNSVSYPAKNGCFSSNSGSFAELDISNDDLGGDVTISFWSKGVGSAGQTTSLLEAVDSLGNRVINIHFPWSDNMIYWDAGSSGGYDRISKAISPSIIDGAWHHWSFVKKTSTGQMFIYLDGILWHSGTGFTRPVGRVAKFILGSSVSLTYDHPGILDEFQIYKSAVTASEILAWKNKKIDNTHPNYGDLVAYYDFDDEMVIRDKSVNNRLGMPSQYGMIHFDEYPVAGAIVSGTRPNLHFGQGSLGELDSTLVNILIAKEPQVIFEYAPTDNSFAIINTTVAYPQVNSYVFDYEGLQVSSTPISTPFVISNNSINYYNNPFELVNAVEIARYITPYGISFDLGPNGFSWIYDVTDYQQYLHNLVDLSAHNTQELLDLKFAFIEGIPPRDVHKREPIWSDYKSYQYAALSANTVLAPISIALSDTSSMFKIKTRLTGHGQEGAGSCCEWKNNNHSIFLDGINRFNWNIWRPDACANNPNIRQGGTWPYAREGWCPGDLVPEFEYDITPFVTPGESVTIDYGISTVPTSDLAQGGGNYVAALDLISYSAPNFQNDAAIVDVLNPNNYEYYSKWNPTCSNPRIILQNTGAQPLTSCKIRCWITFGEWLEYTWTGSLGFLEKTTVEIPVTNLNWWSDYDGTKIFNAQVYDINGITNLDQYSPNNVKSTKFAAPEFMNGPFYIWFITNNKASENKYKLVDQNGTVIFERTTLVNSTTYKDTFDLDPGCYSIILEDSDDDGIGFWYSNQVEGETTGQFRVRLVGGATMESFPSDFGRYHRYDFSVGFTLKIDESKLDNAILIYPNPNNGNFQIELSGIVKEQAKLEIIDISGRPIFQEEMQANEYFASSEINLQHINAGHYFVKITTNNGVYMKEFVKNE